ncbi:hypothetical protein SCP_1101760 [Sparassis crispa]|uniref:Aminoglycoside phosphotransferase domain-containing protein n=1 Tax=Sparassis crispa TaxID=139825 RepID=A0A401GZC9_9APHY|nr:hypothetical protein SCP_1101760 [Sparassis crispa]GBE87499.1 hypothetical protein SCP_1101760 [Sparassis crispa]
MASRISFIPMTNTPYYVIAPYDDVPLSYLLNETAIMTAPSIQTVHTSTVDQLLQQQESSLAKSPFYLGNPTLSNHVDWFCKDPSNDQLIVKQRTPDDPPQLADLTCIGEIGSDHYYMFPGGYNTANDKLPQGNTEFERVRGYFRLHPPRKKIVRDLWKPMLDGLKKLQSTVPNARGPIRYSIVEEGVMLKIRHDWFEFQYVVQSDEEQSDNNDSLSPSDKVSECSSTTHLTADETDSESRKSVTELDTEFGIVGALRRLEQDPSDRFIGHIGRQPLLDIVFDEYPNSGPFPTVPAFHDYFSNLPFEFNASMPHPFRSKLIDDVPIVFTHSDLHPSNVIVSAEGDGAPRVVAIIDWHQSGWYPSYWEYCKARLTAEVGSEWETGYLWRILQPTEQWEDWNYFCLKLGV